MKYVNGGWGDGSVGKTLTVHTWGPERRSQNPGEPHSTCGSTHVYPSTPVEEGLEAGGSLGAHEAAILVYTGVTTRDAMEGKDQHPRLFSDLLMHTKEHICPCLMLWKSRKWCLLLQIKLGKEWLKRTMREMTELLFWEHRWCSYKCDGEWNRVQWRGQRVPLLALLQITLLGMENHDQT